MSRLSDYFYIFATLGFTVYGQLILKWRIAQFGSFPAGWAERCKFLLSVLLDPGVFSGFVAAFLASFAWMVVMTKFDLSYAYPFMSLNFVVVLCLSAWLLHEPITAQKLIGMALIVVGTIVASKG